MGDTFSDPVDHLRTTRPHAGRAVIDVMGWPGYSLLVVGMLTGAASLVGFATGHDRQGVLIVALALMATAMGTVWLLIEHKRIDRVTHQWHSIHPGVPRQQ
ncbi:MAG TPA: protein UsfY, partial [Mycobacterium sp.]|nr:protein UsfY [Mycobacterium sp.]